MVSLTVREGDFLAVVGRSGSGKSTLLRLLAGVERPSSGTIVTVTGAPVSDRRGGGRCRHRVGLASQGVELRPNLTVCENVVMNIRAGGSVGEREASARWWLARLGIAEEADKLPGMLSGGQQQRAAIARVLADDPTVVLADDPTANLDPHTAAAVLDVLMDLNYEGRTIVVASHEQSLRACVKREITLDAGRLVADRGVVPAQD
ncbi:ABC transporter ATP-binding protein [Nocardia takedensis]|nr:ATP-binding cassette domain-containing protein [Nocardia takedensis]